MESIKSFFKRAENIEAPDVAVRQRAIEIINELSGVSLTLKRVTVKNFLLQIVGSSVERNEVILHKQEILKRLTDEFGKKAPIDIR